MIERYAKVDKGKEDYDKADEDAACREGLERECHRPASHEPIGENERETNSMDHCFLKIDRTSQEMQGVMGPVRTFVWSFLGERETEGKYKHGRYRQSSPSYYQQ